MPYALYIHGMGSGAKSGTRSSLSHYLPQYEWLCPELPLDPQQAMAVLRDYQQVFQPALIVGTSLGGLFTLFLEADIKIAVNATYNIDTTLRRLGYGKHKFHCEREDGATEYVIDEPLVQAYRHLRDSESPLPSPKMIAFFSSDDELIGREPTKQNARAMEALGYQVVWSTKCGHRLNQPAAKQLAALVV